MTCLVCALREFGPPGGTSDNTTTGAHSKAMAVYSISCHRPLAETIQAVVRSTGRGIHEAVEWSGVPRLKMWAKVAAR